jgi:D-glycero-D-manno-heptose 1,7-bisphosphate phosphatase
VPDVDRARPALFLDRDGTLIVDVGYPKEPNQVTVLEGAVAALNAARAKGYALVVVRCRARDHHTRRSALG